MGHLIFRPNNNSHLIRMPPTCKQNLNKHGSMGHSIFSHLPEEPKASSQLADLQQTIEQVVKKPDTYDRLPEEIQETELYKLAKESPTATGERRGKSAACAGSGAREGARSPRLRRRGRGGLHLQDPRHAGLGVAVLNCRRID